MRVYLIVYSFWIQRCCMYEIIRCDIHTRTHANMYAPTHTVRIKYTRTQTGTHSYKHHHILLCQKS